MRIRLVPKSVTLNGVMAVILPYFTKFSLALGDNYVKLDS